MDRALRASIWRSLPRRLISTFNSLTHSATVRGCTAANAALAAASSSVHVAPLSGENWWCGPVVLARNSSTCPGIPGMALLSAWGAFHSFAFVVVIVGLQFRPALSPA
jgi:hypothetical protein